MDSWHPTPLTVPAGAMFAAVPKLSATTSRSSMAMGKADPDLLFIGWSTAGGCPCRAVAVVEPSEGPAARCRCWLGRPDPATAAFPGSRPSASARVCGWAGRHPAGLRRLFLIAAACAAPATVRPQFRGGAVPTASRAACRAVTAASAATRAVSALV
jgi:hypothetical protein